MGAWRSSRCWRGGFALHLGGVNSPNFATDPRKIPIDTEKHAVIYSLNFIDTMFRAMV